MTLIMQILRRIIAMLSKPGSEEPKRPVTKNGLKIKEHLLTLNRWSRPGKKLKGVKGVVIHWVANPMTSAQGNRNWFEKRKGGKNGFGSTQYIIDLDGTVIRMIPDDEIAYGAGARKYVFGIQDKLGKYPNDWTLHIECTHIDWAGTMKPTTYSALVKLCRKLLKTHKLTTDDLYLHYEITGKECHRWFVRNPKEWAHFKKVVSK